MSAVPSPSDLSTILPKGPQKLILASTSKYRKELLTRLGVPFTCVDPNVDERALTGESPMAMALRLAEAKALAVSKMDPDAWVIGSDQVVDLQGVAMGKPGDHAKALKQLQSLRGHTVQFHTAVCLAKGPISQVMNVVTEVTFRDLDDATLNAYLLAETPYDCAGSAKSEGLGICLLEKVQSDDPTALIGLPLITICTFLRNAGFQIPKVV
jgi:septum formation protein